MYRSVAGTHHRPERQTSSPWRSLWWFVVPVVIATLLSVRRDWFPVADLSLVDLKLRDIWVHPPLTGPYSRFGWDHPGPIMYWLLWLPWKLAGGHARGLLFATLLWHCAAATISLYVGGKVGGRALQVCVALALGAAAVSVTADALVQPWNPYLNLMLVPGLVVACAGAATGDRLASLWCAGIASVMAQNHLGLLPPAIVLAGLWLLIMLVAMGRKWRRSGGDPSTVAQQGLTIGWSMAVVGALWALPLYQQFSNSPGNLELLWKFAREDHDSVGLTGAARIVGRMFGPTPPWLGFRYPLEPFHGGVDTGIGGWATMPVLLVIPVIAVIVALRRADWARLRVLLATLVVLALGFVSVVGISGEPHVYLVGWIAIAVALWMALSAWTIGEHLYERVGAGERFGEMPTEWMSSIALGVVGVLVAGSIVAAPNPYAGQDDQARSLAYQLLDSSPGDTTPWVFGDTPDFAGLTYISSLMSFAESRGISAYGPVTALGGLDESWLGPGPERRRDFLILTSSAARPLLTDPNWRIAAQHQPFSSELRDRIWGLLDRIAFISAKPELSRDDEVERYFSNEEVKKLQGGDLDVYVFERRRGPSSP